MTATASKRAFITFGRDIDTNYFDRGVKPIHLFRSIVSVREDLIAALRRLYYSLFLERNMEETEKKIFCLGEVCRLRERFRQ